MKLLLSTGMLGEAEEGNLVVALRFTPAFGSVVGVCDAGLLARLKPCPTDCW